MENSQRHLVSPEIREVLERLDRESYVPLYVQLANRFAKLIRSGRLPPGARLPSEADCSRHSGVSRLTVRQAMAKLRSEGLISRTRGGGTFISPVKVQHHLAFSFEEEMLASGIEVTPHFLSWRKVAPPATVASALRLGPGELAFRLDRLRLIYGTPIGLEIRFLREDIGEKLDPGDLRTEPIFTVLQRLLAQPIERVVFTIGCVAATAREARLLRTPKATPLLTREHTYYTVADAPVLHGTTLFLGDRYKFSFESGAGQLKMSPKFDMDVASMQSRDPDSSDLLATARQEPEVT